MPPGAPSPGASAAQSREHLQRLLTPVVTAAGYDLEDVLVKPAGRRSVVQVVLDRDGGVDLDAVADISRAVSSILDADNTQAFGGPYVLEVTSPGVDRPLTEHRHWRRNVGRLVQAEVTGVPVTARIEAVEDAGVTLRVDGVSRPVAWADLGTGRVQVEFGPVKDVTPRAVAAREGRR